MLRDDFITSCGIDVDAWLGLFQFFSTNSAKINYAVLLPEEIIFYIFKFLAARDLAMVGKTCRSWRRISSSNELWASLFNQNKSIPRQYINQGYAKYYTDLRNKFRSLMNSNSNYQLLLDSKQMMIEDILDQFKVYDKSSKGQLGFVRCMDMNEIESAITDKAVHHNFFPGCYSSPHNADAIQTYSKLNFTDTRSVLLEDNDKINNCSSIVVYADCANKTNLFLSDLKEKLNTLPFIILVAVNSNVEIKNINYPILQLIHLSELAFINKVLSNKSFLNSMLPSNWEKQINRAALDLVWTKISHSMNDLNQIHASLHESQLLSEYSKNRLTRG